MGIDAEMFVRTHQEFTPAQVRTLSADLCEAFGRDEFYVWEDWKNQDGTKGRHALELVPYYEQDGPVITPDPGEVFIRVHLATRYYGQGYERGNIGIIVNVAEWLEARIPDARVWYGGDSSGICAEPFGPVQRGALLAHFHRVGHKPYEEAFSAFDDPDRVVRCGFCAVRMISTGGGCNRTFYYCYGCGKKVIQHKDGQVDIVPRGKDFFDARSIL